MSLEVLENSVNSGTPVELYVFSNGANAWFCTNAEVPISLELLSGFANATDLLGSTPLSPEVVVFTPIAISRSGIVRTQELEKSTLEITVPVSFPLVGLHNLYPPSDITAVSIYRVHRTEAVMTTANVLIEWLGRVLSVVDSPGAPESAVLRCESVITSIKRPGLRQLYQRACSAVLYSPRDCKVDKLAFKATKTIESISGLAITVAEADLVPEYYSGGMMSWANNGFSFWRTITINSSNLLNINFPLFSYSVDGQMSEVPTGASIDLYPGCPHTMTACRDTFDNLVNFPGMPYIPLLNPFGGTAIY